MIIDDPQLSQRLLEYSYFASAYRGRRDNTLSLGYGKLPSYPPKIIMITKRVQTPIDEESVETLDYAEIEWAAKYAELKGPE